MVTVLALLGVLAVLFAAAVLSTREEGLLAEVAPDEPDVPLPDKPLTPEDVSGLRFSLAARGYRMSQVDAVLERLAAELADRDRRIGLLEAAAEGSQDAASAAPPVREATAQDLPAPDAAAPPAPASAPVEPAVTAPTPAPPPAASPPARPEPPPSPAAPPAASPPARPEPPPTPAAPTAAQRSATWSAPSSVPEFPVIDAPEHDEPDTRMPLADLPTALATEEAEERHTAERPSPP